MITRKGFFARKLLIDSSHRTLTYAFNKVIENCVVCTCNITSYYLFCTFIKVVTLMFIGIANLDWWLLTSSWWCVKVTCKLDSKTRLYNLRTIFDIVLFDVKMSSLTYSQLVRIFIRIKWKSGKKIFLFS